MKRLGNREQENASERRSRRRTTRGSERCSGAFDSERERERERERVWQCELSQGSALDCWEEEEDEERG